MLEGGQPALNPGDAVRLGVFDPRHLRSWRMKAESLPADWNPVGSAKGSVQVRRSPLVGYQRADVQVASDSASATDEAKAETP